MENSRLQKKCTTVSTPWKKEYRPPKMEETGAFESEWVTKDRTYSPKNTTFMIIIIIIIIIIINLKIHCPEQLKYKLQCY
jgi:hypothetical protein